MKRLRSALGMTQMKLAEALGCNHGWISQAEHGQELGGETTRKVFDRYRKECDSLGLTAEDFIRGKVMRRRKAA